MVGRKDHLMGLLQTGICIIFPLFMRKAIVIVVSNSHLGVIGSNTHPQ